MPDLESVADRLFVASNEIERKWTTFVLVAEKQAEAYERIMSLIRFLNDLYGTDLFNMAHELYEAILEIYIGGELTKRGFPFIKAVVTTDKPVQDLFARPYRVYERHKLAYINKIKSRGTIRLLEAFHDYGMNVNSVYDDPLYESIYYVVDQLHTLEWSGSRNRDLNRIMTLIKFDLKRIGGMREIRKFGFTAYWLFARLPKDLKHAYNEMCKLMYRVGGIGCFGNDEIYEVIRSIATAIHIVAEKI